MHVHTHVTVEKATTARACTDRSLTKRAPTLQCMMLATHEALSLASLFFLLWYVLGGHARRVSEVTPACYAREVAAEKCHVLRFPVDGDDLAVHLEPFTTAITLDVVLGGAVQKRFRHDSQGIWSMGPTWPRQKLRRWTQRRAMRIRSRPSRPTRSSETRQQPALRGKTPNGPSLDSIAVAETWSHLATAVADVCLNCSSRGCRLAPMDKERCIPFATSHRTRRR